MSQIDATHCAQFSSCFSKKTYQEYEAEMTKCNFDIRPIFLSSHAQFSSCFTGEEAAALLLPFKPYESNFRFLKGCARLYTEFI